MALLKARVVNVEEKESVVTIRVATKSGVIYSPESDEYDLVYIPVHRNAIKLPGLLNYTIHT